MGALASGWKSHFFQKMHNHHEGTSDEQDLLILGLNHFKLQIILMHIQKSQIILLHRNNKS